MTFSNPGVTAGAVTVTDDSTHLSATLTISPGALLGRSAELTRDVHGQVLPSLLAGMEFTVIPAAKLATVTPLTKL